MNGNFATPFCIPADFITLDNHQGDNLNRPCFDLIRLCVSFAAGEAATGEEANWPFGSTDRPVT